MAIALAASIPFSPNSKAILCASLKAIPHAECFALVAITNNFLIKSGSAIAHSKHCIPPREPPRSNSISEICKNLANSW